MIEEQYPIYWICPDCHSTYVQDCPIVPDCTSCAVKAGWYQNDRGIWTHPRFEQTEGA